MNIFYTPGKYIFDDFLELRDQEAKHATKVLRYESGDDITVVDGVGGTYKGRIGEISEGMVRVDIEDSEFISRPEPYIILAMGILKKRDRMEFAVEKAVELGVSEVVLFRGKHSVKQNVRRERLESTAFSAMKQSLRPWKPEISVVSSMSTILNKYADTEIYLAHQQADNNIASLDNTKGQNKVMLMVGPEGGFAEDEVNMAVERGARVISLGNYRLRAETAAIAFIYGIQ